MTKSKGNSTGTEIVTGATVAGATSMVSALVSGAGLSQGVAQAFVAITGALGGEVAKRLATASPATLQLEAALAESRVRRLESVTDDVAHRVTKLEQEGVEPDVIIDNSCAALRAWEEADRNADDERKRKMILAGLVNSFDREAYDAGMTKRLF